MSDNLDKMKAKRAVLVEKATKIKAEISEINEKINELDKKIFEQEDGRILTAAKLALASTDGPGLVEFKKVMNVFLEKLELDGTGKRGRPAKKSPGRPKTSQASK